MLVDTLSAQTENAWSVLFKGHLGPPGAWKLLQEPFRPLLLWCHTGFLHDMTYREAAVIQTALLIIDMIVICSTIAPSAFFLRGRGLVWPHRGIFRSRISLQGPMRITLHRYAFINNANPKAYSGSCPTRCVLIQTHCRPKYWQSKIYYFLILVHFI